MAKAVVSAMWRRKPLAKAVCISHMRFGLTYPAVSHLTAVYSRAIQYSITCQSRAAQPTHPLDVIVSPGSERLYSHNPN